MALQIIIYKNKLQESESEMNERKKICLAFFFVDFAFCVSSALSYFFIFVNSSRSHALYNIVDRLCKLIFQKKIKIVSLRMRIYVF